MKCIAIDDEVNALKVIEHYAGKVEKLRLLATFTDPVRAANFLESNAVDLVFLDINMPDLNGFDLLETLVHRPQVVFTTAYSEYAVKSYSVDALDYLMKPINFSRFLKAINKAQEYFNIESQEKMGPVALEEKIISIKSGTSIHRIKLDDILYLAADGNYTRFVTAKESIMVLCNMKTALEKVNDGFIQTHRSYAVAISKVEKVDVHELKVGGKVLPIGSSHRKKVLDLFS